ETKDETRALIYSVKNINLREIFQNYEPTGAIKAIKIKINRDLINAQTEIIELAKKMLVKIV
ncbi:MAG: hypothetical protein NTX66_00600, partial [Candidatus Falkowbacteria bacterium]|nr:hypothetical protein [Candidatus Falkowbacteria bacterium]